MNDNDPPNPERQARTRRPPLVVSIIVTVLAVASLIYVASRAASSSVASVEPPVTASVTPTPTIPVTRSALYEVTTTSRSGGFIDITYSTPTGPEQQTGVDVPLTREDGSRGLAISVSGVPLQRGLTGSCGDDLGVGTEHVPHLVGLLVGAGVAADDDVAGRRDRRLRILARTLHIQLRPQRRRCSRSGPVRRPERLLTVSAVTPLRRAMRTLHDCL